jgi:carboxypeptidase Taq
MSTILSPAEALGLSGATLEGRVLHAAHNVSDAVLARIAEKLRTDAWASRMIYEHDGVEEAVRIMLRPLLVMPEQLSYVHHVCLQLIEALKRLPALYLEDERIRHIVAINPEEEQWLRDTWTPAHAHFNSIYGRLDATCDFTGAAWQDSLFFMEANLSSVGGIHFSPVAEDLVLRNVVPTLFAKNPEIEISLPRDQRDLFVQLLIDHARTIGRQSCQLCFVEAKYVHDGPNEQAVLSDYLSEKHNLTIAHADPTELRLVGDEVYYEDTRIDVAYRDYEMRELLELEKETGKRLDAMRLLFRQNRIVSSIVGDFDHKTGLEVLTDPTFTEKYFTADDRRLFRRHVLWTRLIGDRKTSFPDGREGDLLPYIRRNRETLIIKPNRAYGGTGVVLGASTTQAEWERVIDEAAALVADPEKSSVVQKATRLPVHEFPVLGADNRVLSEPFYSVMGFAATENGLGTMVRVSQKQVVNVAQRGGLAALLEANAPPELSIPTRSVNRTAGAESELSDQIRELRHLDHIIQLLEWDEEVMMPDAGREARGGQRATVEGLRHALLVSDYLGDLVEEVSSQRRDDPNWGRELHLLRRERRQAMALPQDLVRHFAAARSQAIGAWEEAREKNDFALFARPLDHLLDLLRTKASALAAGGNAYDALLDEHDEGLDRARLDPVFDALRQRLGPWVQKASESARRDSGLPDGRTFAEAGQRELCREILSSMGFDTERGRLDRSTHPFSVHAGPADVRLTIRIDESDPTSAILAAIHEGGHGLYDLGVDPADRDRLVGAPVNMSMHECQARLWENHVGRSLAFWRFALPRMRDLFPEAMKGIDAETLYRDVNQVKAGSIRVDADELSYHLHIILRYELEMALVSGALQARDLPAAWAERSLALFGTAPSNDREGVLQDIHWAGGEFGYFPTYTLGSLYAAQLAEAYARDHRFEDEIARGAFGSFLGWLRQHAHGPGQRFTAEEIIRKATGAGLDSGAFFRHLERKFGAP